MKPTIYKDNRSMSKAVIGLLTIAAFVDMTGIVVQAMQISLISGAVQPEQIDLAKASASDARIAFQALLETGVRILTASAFLAWLYRSHRNLIALGSNKLKFTSGWAVGYFFIPVINLYRPLQILSEVWNRSVSAAAPSQSTEGIPPLVGGWWCAFLGASLAKNVASRMALAEGQELSAVANSSWLGIFAYLFSILAAVLAIQMINGICKHQDDRHQGLHPAPSHAFM